MSSRVAQPFCLIDLSLHGEESGERGTVCRAQVSGHRGVVGNVTSGLTAEKAHLPLLLRSSSAFINLGLQKYRIQT